MHANAGREVGQRPPSPQHAHPTATVGADPAAAMRGNLRPHTAVLAPALPAAAARTLDAAAHSTRPDTAWGAAALAAPSGGLTAVAAK